MQLDERLREALTQEAAAIPSSAAERLRAIDYRPRSRAVPKLLAGGAIAGAAAGAGLLLAAGTSTQTAFAGWRASPTRAQAAQTAPVEAQCTARLTAGRPTGKTGGTAPTEPRVTDTRGPFTLVVYDDAVCIAGPGFLSVHGAHAADGVAISTAYRDGQIFTIADGPVPAGATAATLSLQDGSTVEATVANSLLAAWWPSMVRPASVSFTTPSGTQTEPLNFPPAPPLPAAKAARVRG